MPSQKRTRGLSDSSEAKRAKPNTAPTKANGPTGSVSEALKAAIKTAQPNRLVSVVLSLCETNPLLVKELNELLLVKGKQVVRYHADTESEDEGAITDTKGDSDDSDIEIERMKNPFKPKKVASDTSKAIAVGDEEYTAKYATCLNCKEEFDVTVNERGMCRWHAGEKYVYHDGDFWADHDENCHGRYEDWEDDEDYSEGFMWDCCQKEGSHKGCQSTKHKANANQVVS